jgi:outer membrane protein TolC
VLDLELARTGVERSALDVTLAEREAFPVLSLFADAGMLTSIENLRLPSADRSKILGYSVGLLVEFPLFDWGGRGLRKEQKELEFNSLSTRRTLLERKLSGEMARLRLQLRNGQERLEILRRNAAKAKDLFLLIKARYAGGSALAVEVLGAQQLLNDSEVAALQTLAEIQSLSARIVQLTTQEER